MPTMSIRVESARTELVDNTFRALQQAHDQVETLVHLAENMAEKGEADAASVDSVTIELIGVVAAIASDVDSHVADLGEFHERLGRAIPALIAIRSEQLRRRQDADDQGADDATEGGDDG